MTETYTTTNKELVIPDINSKNWGDEIQNAFNDVDAYLKGIGVNSLAKNSGDFNSVSVDSSIGMADDAAIRYGTQGQFKLQYNHSDARIELIDTTTQNNEAVLYTGLSDDHITFSRTLRKETGVEYVTRTDINNGEISPASITTDSLDVAGTVNADTVDAWWGLITAISAGNVNADHVEATSLDADTMQGDRTNGTYYLPIPYGGGLGEGWHIQGVLDDMVSGGELVINGNHELDEALSPPDNRTVTVNGSLQMTDTANQSVFFRSASNPATNITIRGNGFIDGAGSEGNTVGHGIDFSGNAANIQIRNITISDIAENGINMAGNGGYINNVRLFGVGDTAINIHSTTTQSIISDNRINGATTGIDFGSGSDYNIINSNYIDEVTTYISGTAGTNSILTNTLKG